jgi:hypothetical protein
MAKNSKRKRSTRQALHYSMYQDEMRAEKNRIRKLKRHVKKFPLDFTASDALEVFKAKGVSYRRKNRTVGIKLPEHMKILLKQTGNRLTSAKVALLGLLNQPIKRRAQHIKPTHDYISMVLERRIRVKKVTSMGHAFAEAKRKQDEAIYT